MDTGSLTPMQGRRVAPISSARLASFVPRLAGVRKTRVGRAEVGVMKLLRAYGECLGVERR